MTAQTAAHPTAARPPRSGALTVTLCRDPAGFAGLAGEWDGLYRRCRSATPFQTHAWLHSWWLSYGVPGRLRLLLVRRQGRLVGAAPLILAHRPVPVLLPIGVGVSDFCDVLLDDSCAEAAAASLAHGLAAAAAGALVDLREVRPGAAAERLFANWPGSKRRLPDSLCMELPGRPVDELLNRMPSSSARRSRSKLRKLDILGIEPRSVPEREVADALVTMLRLHCLQWEGRGVTPEHRRPRFAEHLVRAVRQMVGTGDARVTEYVLEGRVVATDVTLMSAELSGGYLYGAHPDLRAAKADINTMLLRHDAAHAAETGRSVVSLLRGNEEYKRHWRPVAVTNQRLLLSRPGLAPALYLHAAQVAARLLLVRVARARLPALLAWRTRLNNWRAWGGGGGGAPPPPPPAPPPPPPPRPPPPRAGGGGGGVGEGGVF
ncbi:GNAT family N-acetyltransferase [Streptomyces sp. NPDC004647]|uniref:GNAT family N-acetyltransferase n=1 Tax=Streptomyces sp. NPDC004647 TaxID=3154671 RepID=UPI0033B3E33B